MEQASWFDFVENDWDPVFRELQKLTEENRTIHIDTYTIMLNRFDLIEIEGAGVHDCVSTLEQCYHYLCEYSK